jgi:hypothetical protein
MAKAPFEAQGLAGAAAVTRMLGMLTAAKGHGQLDVGERTDTKHSNAEIMDFLAEGGRDIRPSTNKPEIQKSAEAFTNEYVRQMNLAKNTVKASEVAAKKAFRVGMLTGLKKAMQEHVRGLKERLKTGRDNYGARKPVTEEYAKARKSKYGWAEDVIFIATKQLGEAILHGKIKVDPGDTSRAFDLFGKK